MNMREPIHLSSGEIITRYQYHQLSADDGVCPCAACVKVRLYAEFTRYALTVDDLQAIRPYPEEER